MRVGRDKESLSSLASWNTWNRTISSAFSFFVELAERARFGGSAREYGIVNKRGEAIKRVY